MVLTQVIQVSRVKQDVKQGSSDTVLTLTYFQHQVSKFTNFKASKHHQYVLDFSLLRYD